MGRLFVQSITILALGCGVALPASAGVSCAAVFGSSRVDASKTTFATLAKQIDLTAKSLSLTPVNPREWRRRTAASGLPAADLPLSLGGANLSTLKMAQLFERAGHHSLDLRDVVGAAHARPLLRSNEPEVRAIVERVARGDAYMAIAITEEGAGSNMRAMKSTSERTEGGYFLTGSKLYNARLESATHVVLFTQAPLAGEGKLNAFVLPLDYPGLKLKSLEAHGLLANSFGGVSFDKLFVPEKYRIGADGEGGAVFRDHFLYWRLMMASAAIGTGKGAIAQVAERLKTREAFGAPIGRFTHLQQPLAEYTAKLLMASLLVKEAAQKIDRGQTKEAVALVAMAKAEGVEIALEAADYAMKTFGAEGYSTRVDLGQRVQDLMGLRIADGTTDVLRSEVVRRIYGDELWDMAIETHESGARP